MKTIVKFLKPSTRYNAGDVAGFDAVTAASLIGAGIAAAYTAPSNTIGDLSTNTQQGMEQVREFARTEEARLFALADGIQKRETEGHAELEARERAVKQREDDVAKREAALDQGQAAGASTDPAVADAPILAAEQTGPLPPNGATPPTGEGHEGDLPNGDTVTVEQAPVEEVAEALPVQGQARKGK